MKKRVLSLIMALCLALALLPAIPARATDSSKTYTVAVYQRFIGDNDDNLYRSEINYQYQAGETVTVTPSADQGFKFKEWENLDDLTLTEGGKNTQAIKFVMPKRDVSVEAIFEPDAPLYTVYIEKYVYGEIIGRRSFPRPAETTININVDDDHHEGYQFQRWEDTERLIAENKINDKIISFVLPAHDVTLKEIMIPDNPFTDVHESDYFYNPVLWAVGKEITNGTSKTAFSPGRTCTTANIITFLWRANASPEPGIANPFSDVKSDDYFVKAAAWAYEKGLVSGGKFEGNSPCTRAAVMKYLWILAEKPSGGSNPFTDVPSNADYAQAIAWAVQKGITNGKNETTFAPDETCTRGQIVTFLYRNYTA